MRKYWDRTVYPKLLIYEELNEIFENSKYLHQLILEKTIDVGKPFEKLSIPDLVEKIRYVSVNELGNYLRKLNKSKDNLTFQAKLQDELFSVKNNMKLGKVKQPKIEEIVKLTGIYEKIREKKNS